MNKRNFLILTTNSIGRGEVEGFNHLNNTITQIIQNPKITYNSQFDPSPKNNEIRLINSKFNIGTQTFESDYIFKTADLILGIDDTPKRVWMQDFNSKENINIKNKTLQYEIVFNFENGYTTIAHFSIDENDLGDKKSIENILETETFLPVHNMKYLFSTKRNDEYDLIVEKYLENCLFNQDPKFSPRAVINLKKLKNFKLINEIPNELFYNSQTGLWELIKISKF